MLSVIILTKNEEDRLAACLESVKWADEVIVVDNGSEDQTLEIAKRYTDKIIEYKNQDFAFLRNQGAKVAQGDWMLYIDSDERVLANLKNEIEALITFDNLSAYAIRRQNIVFGKEVKYGSYRHDWVIRLLRKSDLVSWVGKVHEYPKFKGKLGYSKHSFLHLTHRNIDQIVLKSLEWSKIDAKLRLDANHPKMSGWRFLRIFVTEVFHQGFIRKGFFNGTIGVMDSLLQAFSLYMTYVRLWEMQQAKPIHQIYDDLDKELIGNNFKYP